MKKRGYFKVPIKDGRYQVDYDRDCILLGVPVNEDSGYVWLEYDEAGPEMIPVDYEEFTAQCPKAPIEDDANALKKELKELKETFMSQQEGLLFAINDIYQQLAEQKDSMKTE